VNDICFPDPDVDQEEIDPETLTVEELREKIDARRQIIDAITREIEENDSAHRAMDSDHRSEIIAERRCAIGEKKVLARILATKVGKPPKTPKAAPPEHLERMRLEQEASARKKAERLARHEATEAAETERNKVRTQLFVKAAYRILPREEFEAIWEKAREWWPDSPAWLARPSDEDGA